MLRKALCLVTLASVSHSSANAQAPATPTPHYDVVSIKPNNDVNSPTRWRTTADSFLGNNMSLMMLLVTAYDTRPDLVSGLSGWAATAHFDITAKTEADPAAMKNLPQSQRNAMLIQLLAERFQLKIHLETKQLPVYDLVVSKEGPKLRPNTAVVVMEPGVLPKPGMRPGMILMNHGEFTAEAVPLSSLTHSLASELERNIIDKTGLTANYDIHLKYTPDRGASAGPDSGKSEDAAPPLFTALEQQLGLKLISAKGPVQTWVVDHIDHPTDN